MEVDRGMERGVSFPGVSSSLSSNVVVSLLSVSSAVEEIGFNILIFHGTKLKAAFLSSLINSVYQEW